jgi:Ankyrin repeats (many copies)
MKKLLLMFMLKISFVLSMESQEMLQMQLIRACELNDISAVKKVLLAGADSNKRPIESRYPTRFDHWEGDPYVYPEYYPYAIHAAVIKANLPLVKLLISLKADMHVRNSSNQTPLLYSIQMGYIPLVKLLLEKQAYSDTPESLTTDYLYKALAGRHYEIAKVLIATGAPVDSNILARLPYFHVQTDEKQLQFLIAHIQPFSKTYTQLNQESINQAIEWYHIAGLKWLLVQQRLPLIEDNVLLAITRDYVKLIPLLLEYCVIPRIPFFYQSIEQGRVSIVKIILKNNRLTLKEFKALFMHAKKHSQKDIGIILVHYGGLFANYLAIAKAGIALVGNTIIPQEIIQHIAGFFILDRDV